MNDRIVTVKIPGTATGRMTRRIACSRLAPSTVAASSSWRGSWVKKLARNQVAIGTV
jgi:hypothetical protein